MSTKFNATNVHAKLLSEFLGIVRLLYARFVQVFMAKKSAEKNDVDAVTAKSISIVIQLCLDKS